MFFQFTGEYSLMMWSLLVRNFEEIIRLPNLTSMVGIPSDRTPASYGKSYFTSDSTIRGATADKALKAWVTYIFIRKTGQKMNQILYLTIFYK